jgi:hypothetical protein
MNEEEREYYRVIAEILALEAITVAAKPSSWTTAYRAIKLYCYCSWLILKARFS